MFLTPDQTVIRSNILRDIQNLLAEAAVSDDSDFGVRASAVSSAIEGLYQHQQWIVRQLFPDTADVDLMEIHAALRNIRRKAATYAVGSITFTGTPGTNIPVGTETKTIDGIAFVTTSAAVIAGGGSIDVASQAVLAGVTGNVTAATPLTLTAAPGGVNAAALIVSMLSGTDIETDASLLGRLLFILRNPPASGNKADYKRWALEVDGCDGAFVYPLRRGLGTCDVIITSAGGLPSAGLISDVFDHIDELRPCGVNTLAVLAPTLLVQNHTMQIKVSGVTLVDATTMIDAALDNYYATLLPGDPYIKSVVEALISGIVGITDRAISDPTGNVVPTVDDTAVQWCRKGTLAVTLMP